MHADALVKSLEVETNRIPEAMLTVSVPFRFRTRGVETRILIEGTSHHRDRTLIGNIAKAYRYLAMVQAGQTLGEIAAAEGVSNHHIQKLIDLAVVAPDIVRDILQGTQSTGLTSEWLLRQNIPADWSKQRKLFATL